MEALIFFGLCIFLPAMILTVEYLSWRYSGWSRLQIKYNTRQMPSGNRFYQVSGILGLGVFQKSINCGYNGLGFFFWQFLYWDGFFHKKLFIPWSAVEDLTIERESVSFSVEGQRIKLLSRSLAKSLSIEDPKVQFMHKVPGN